MIDQGSGVEVMYSDLYEGLGLTPEDWTKYNSPLIAFDWSIVMPTGQVTLPLKVEKRKEFVHFVVVIHTPHIRQSSDVSRSVP